MEKLTYNQIVEQLKNSGMSVYDFAYEETPALRVDGKFSEKALEAKRVKEQWIKENPNPGYVSPQWEEWHGKWSSFPSEYDVAQQEWLEQNSLPTWEEVDQEGGEDQGSHWHSVKYFKDHDVYIKVTGWYSSYNGTDFEDWDSACNEVCPQQKIITVWE
jgi:hypothetical protein